MATRSCLRPALRTARSLPLSKGGPAPSPVSFTAATAVTKKRRTTAANLSLISNSSLHRCAPVTETPVSSRSRAISFLAQPPPSGPEDSYRAQYAQLFLDTMLGSTAGIRSGSSGSTRTKIAHPLAHVQSEADVLAVFHSINVQLQYPPETLPPQSAWIIAFQTLLEEDDPTRHHTSTPSTPFIELIRSELESSKRKDSFEYDIGRIYEARSLYNTYLRRLELARFNNVSLEPEEDDLGPALALPLLRAYTHSFVPDIPRAFGLYADLLERGSFAHGRARSGAGGEVYALLIGLCVRNHLFARALRLVRDMTLFGIDQLFHSGSLAALTLDHGPNPTGSDILARTAEEAPLFLTRRNRVDLLNVLMRSATSYAEAYAIYWRLRRMWAGAQAEALAQRLRDRTGEQRERAGSGGILYWARRIASRSDPYEYLGDGVDEGGGVDCGRGALTYWSLPYSAGDEESAAAAVAARESVLLTEDELLAEDAHAYNFQSSRFSLGSILGRLQTRSSKEEAILTIYASQEERMARLNAAPFPLNGWRHILSTFPNLQCGWVEVRQSASTSSAMDTRRTFANRVPRRVRDNGPVGKVERVWIPAPPELVISIFWDMLQSGASPPPPVYTNLLHYYTKLVKSSRQSVFSASSDASHDTPSDAELASIQDHQRRLIASEAITSLHKLIHLDINLEPDLPLINALMNAYGHLGQIHDVLPIWQSLVNLSGGAKVSLSSAGAGGEGQGRVANRMDGQSVAIVLDACGFAASLPLSRARSVVSWVRHRDRLATSFAVKSRSTASSSSPGVGGSRPRPPEFLMSKGAWDAWLECLCRRGHVREAFEVFTQEMVPTLETQRRTFHHDNRRDRDQARPDTKTLGTLLRFAARERDEMGVHKGPPADAPSRRADERRVRPEAGVGVGMVGSTFLRMPPTEGDDALHPPPAASSMPPPRRRDTSVWAELRTWIQQEMPELWDSVRDIGTDTIIRRGGSTRLGK
ncbi:unnamed protein product [Tilletia controversa]|uniref:ATPase expression protein 2, mitochondrial n=2 Tax=Tilletia TaxID=13289 RepID=A0ABN7J3G2_9BASI|nr:hypothetical protein CF336_g3627 [Tilletia laevis]CAD6943815.1 unnamed protein product [Tilletia caries]CAD6972971.1 unnamed protein product [Tilletia controversa]KAE8203803.1 hypothetical protein CF335_g2891 [Tilletia laevis]CAD6947573.1 unnamed protein product [Tilletia caries]